MMWKLKANHAFSSSTVISLRSPMTFGVTVYHCGRSRILLTVGLTHMREF